MPSAAAATPQRCKQAQLARLLGVSRQSIHELVQRNVLPQDADGLIDVELARIAIANRVRPSAKTATASAAASAPAEAIAPSPAVPGADVQMSYHVAKTLREATEAKIAQLKLAEMRGELVRVADVRAATARQVAALREAIMQLPARLAAVLAAESDQANVHDILTGEVRAVLRQVAEGQG